MNSININVKKYIISNESFYQLINTDYENELEFGGFSTGIVCLVDGETKRPAVVLVEKEEDYTYEDEDDNINVMNSVVVYYYRELKYSMLTGHKICFNIVGEEDITKRYTELKEHYDKLYRKKRLNSEEKKLLHKTSFELQEINNSFLSEKYLNEDGVYYD